MTKYSVKKPFTVLVAVVLSLVLGVVSFMGLKTDLLPEMDLPYVIVMTTAPGASPERVEMTVTQPLEQALATTNGLENMQSISMENASMIIMEFSQNVNMDSAMIEMSSSIDLVEGYFDDTVSAPMLMKLNPDMLPVQVVSVDMDGMDIKELSKYVENELSPYLERIDGVATVDAEGLVEDYVSIHLDQEKIDSINDEILAAVDKQLLKTKKELDKAKAELADGKKELEEGQKALEDQQSQAFAKLADATYQLDTANAQQQAMMSQLTQLEAEKAMLNNDQIKAAFTGLDGLRGLNGSFGNVVTGLAGFGIEETKTVAEAITALDGVIASLPENPMLDEQTKTETIAAAETLKMSLQAVLQAQVPAETPLSQVSGVLTAQTAAIETQLTAMGIKSDVIIGGYEALTKAIADIDSEITQAKLIQTQMQSSLSQLQKGYLEAEKAKMAAVSAMAVGQAQLNAAQTQLADAETQLENGIEEFESARDEALKNANIDSLVTQTMISNILTAQNFSMPAGYIMLGEERVTVKVGDKFSDLDSLKNLLLVDMDLDGVDPIYLKDVAEIEIKDNSSDSFVRVNGNPGIVLSLQKSSVASTSEVSESVNKAIEQLMDSTEGLHVTTLMDQGDYIGLIVDSVLSNLIYGGIIALLVLVVFLKSARPTAIIGMSIPLSVLIAIVAMYFTGVTLNIISLSGLALAVGMLVDNSIVVIENIYRLKGLGYSSVKAAVVGTKQVAGAIASSTLTTICVFLPIVFTQGLTRQIFTDMGLTIAYALIASLAVALTFVPCMASNMLKDSKDVSPKFIRKLTDLYEKALRLNLKHKWFVIVMSVVLLVYSVWAAFRMPMAFIPAMDGNQMTMTFTQPSTVSDEELYEKGFEIAQQAQTVEYVDTVAVMSGSGSSVSALSGSATGQTKSLSFYVVLEEDRKVPNSTIAADIESLFPQYTEEQLTVTTEVMDMSALTGGSGISVSVKGNDFDTLGEISKDLADLLMTVDGVASADDGSSQRSSELFIEVDKDAAMRHGLTTAQVYQKVAEALTEETSTTTFTFDGSDLSGYITADTEYSSETITDLQVATTTDDDGEEVAVTLGDIATVTTAESPQSINRDNQSRSYTVSATFEEGVNSTLVSRQAEALLKEYDMPEGYQLVIGGENQTVMEAMGDLLLMILLAVVFIYLIMVAQFQSLLSPFIVLFTIPLAFTGGLLALQLTGTVLSVVSMIGFLVLAGVVVNNGIVFVDYINQLRAEGMERREAIVKTGVDRIRPILMTALTTILAMSTMAFGVGMGAEMSQGMAIVSIGGLAYATLLTLFLVPALYDIFHKKPVKVIDVDFEE